MRARAGSVPLRIASRVLAVTLFVSLFATTGGCADAASGRRPLALAAIVLPAIGFGYAVTSQGPLDASRFPTGSPSATAAAGALSALSDTIDTYQRSWQDAAGVNQVQDLVVHFPTDAAAGAFLGAARRSLAKGEVVSTRPLPSIPGAQRTTYFASTNQAGVGQTITMRRGDYAAVISFFSAATGNPAPITTGSAELVARAQYTAIGSGGSDRAAASHRGGASSGIASWIVLAVAVVALVVAVLLVLRRRGPRTA
jgi:hypothetical protein